ncbi:MAG: 5-methyltetrahydrofolate--homocysteine methyltransferase [Bacteroidetes bacterium]|nr:5-methyltetrahydrofolate--homocysteine methyltransferase [Bacteroidota bacterium]
MHPTLVRLLRSTPVLTDGAWGTQLQALGLRAGECPDAWNLTHPEQVRQVARLYVDAGSAVILTNTFRSNRIALEGFGLADKVVDINTSGVRISREAAAGRALIFASIGPTGKMLMTEEVTPDEMLAAFTEQAAALASAGADALVIETMSDLEEAKLAVQAARTTGLPVVASMVFDSGKDKDRTMMGSTPEQVAEELAAAGADVIGANCGLGMEGYIPIARRLRAATHLPIWIKPNAGLPEMVEGKVTYRTTPEEFARQAAALRDAGVAFVGGCCGTSPQFVHALSTMLR